MKRILHVFTLCLIYVAVQAQPTLLSTEMMPFGSSWTNKSALTLSPIDTTIQGANKVWNFSALTPNTALADFIVYIVNPTTTPYGANFPSANYTYKEVRGTVTNYRYFSLTSTKMERVGSYTSSVNSYNDPQVEFIFPFVLGTQNNDTWDNTLSSTGGTYDLKCIGTGTLIVPAGSFNTLLVRVHCTESFLDFYAYYWYSSDNGAILISYIPGDGVFISPSAYFVSSISIGINENEFITDLRYNNPVENNFELSFLSANNSGYSFTLLNSLGQKVFAGNNTIYSGNTETLNIDFSNYPAGMYFLTLQSNESYRVVKTIKIVKQ